MFPGHSVSMNANQNYSRYMSPVPHGALGNASQALGCRIFQCQVNRSPPWLAGRHEPLLRGTSLQAKAKSSYQAFYFLAPNFFFCCPSSIRIATMEIEKEKKRNTSHPVTSPDHRVKFSTSRAVLKMKMKRHVGTLSDDGSRHPRTCPSTCSRHPRTCPGQHPTLTFPGTDGQIEVPSEVQSSG